MSYDCPVNGDLFIGYYLVTCHMFCFSVDMTFARFILWSCIESLWVSVKCVVCYAFIVIFFYSSFAEDWVF